MKLLVTKPRELSKQVMEAFNLNPDDWKCCGWGDALTGNRYEKVVAIWPTNMSHNESIMYQAYYNQVLCTKLPPGTKPISI